MESILTGLSVISTGSVPSGRAHWIEGAGRPVTLHWRVWMESKIATGWVGGTAIEGGTVLVGSKKEEEEEGNRRGEEEEKWWKEWGKRELIYHYICKYCAIPANLLYKCNS